MLYSTGMSKKLLGLVSLFLVGLVIFTAGAAWWFVQPVAPAGVGIAQQTFIVAKGQGAAAIAYNLTAANLIKHPLAFRVVAKLTGLETQFQAGSYEIAPTMSVSEIVQLLTDGAEDLWVTIPEGWRAEEIAESLAAHELPFFDQTAFLALAKTDEGKLFPDTYLIPKEFTTEQIHALLTNTFDERMNESLVEEVANTQHDLDEALVMASLVEREARGAEEMRHVAGILWHRIEIGMPLQVDATLQYVQGYSKSEESWWPQPSIATKQTQSPFNTYLNPGLPPKPIANPGLDALRAALDPQPTEDLYYLHARNGEIYYAETLDEHNANVQRYLR